MQSWKLTSCVLVCCLVLIGSTLFAGCTQNSAEPGVVKIDSGSISGHEQNGLRVFLGIPFAAPPTGELRWRPPAPVQPWGGVKETKAFGANPPQQAPLNPAVVTSEDCLYLNVWTPAKSADEKLPVMVFFYGGGFNVVEGGGAVGNLNGSTLAQKGVVVVTTNYRIGALGFLAHPQLDNESPHNSSGNYGILDQQATLQWVQRNIGQFGGDPSRVTIFGQSAGADSVFIHLSSPQSKGLYQHAIIESGPFWENGPTIKHVRPKAEAEQFGQEFAANLGYTGPDAVRQMRKMSAAEVINATPWYPSDWLSNYGAHFSPTVDGWVLPDFTENTFTLHHQNPVPLMIGTNADDGYTLVEGANMTVPEYVTFVRNYFRQDADAVLLQYPANSTAEVQLRLGQIMTRYDFADAAKYAAGSMSDLNPDTYLYRYSYHIPDPNLPPLAFHGSETYLLFGHQVPSDPSVPDNVVDLWTRFAKTGNPNGGMNLTWPKYTREGSQYLDINTVPTVMSGY